MSTLKAMDVQRRLVAQMWSIYKDGSEYESLQLMMESTLESLESAPQMCEAFLKEDGLTLMIEVIKSEVFDPSLSQVKHSRMALQILITVCTGVEGSLLDQRRPAFEQAAFIVPIVLLLGDELGDDDSRELAARTLNFLLRSESNSGPVHWLVLSVGGVPPLLELVKEHGRYSTASSYCKGEARRALKELSRLPAALQCIQTGGTDKPHIEEMPVAIRQEISKQQLETLVDPFTQIAEDDGWRNSDIGVSTSSRPFAGNVVLQNGFVVQNVHRSSTGADVDRDQKSREANMELKVSTCRLPDTLARYGHLLQHRPMTPGTEEASRLIAEEEERFFRLQADEEVRNDDIVQEAEAMLNLEEDLLHQLTGREGRALEWRSPHSGMELYHPPGRQQSLSPMDSPMVSGNCEEEDILVAEEMNRGMRSNMSPPSYADVVSAPLPYQGLRPDSASSTESSLFKREMLSMDSTPSRTPPCDSYANNRHASRDQNNHSLRPGSEPVAKISPFSQSAIQGTFGASQGTFGAVQGTFVGGKNHLRPPSGRSRFQL